MTYSPRLSEVKSFLALSSALQPLVLLLQLYFLWTLHYSVAGVSLMADKVNVKLSLPVLLLKVKPPKPIAG